MGLKPTMATMTNMVMDAGNFLKANQLWPTKTTQENEQSVPGAKIVESWLRPRYNVKQIWDAMCYYERHKTRLVNELVLKMYKLSLRSTTRSLVEQTRRQTHYLPNRCSHFANPSNAFLKVLYSNFGGPSSSKDGS